MPSTDHSIAAALPAAVPELNIARAITVDRSALPLSAPAKSATAFPSSWSREPAQSALILEHLDGIVRDGYTAGAR